MFIITDKAKAEGVRKVGGVGVMKGNELKLKEIEAPHTLAGRGEVVSKSEVSVEIVDATLVSNTSFNMNKR